MKAASIACCLLMLVVTANSVAVYRDAFYKTRTIPNVPYVKTLVACTDQTDQATCQETEMVLDVWMPTNTTAGPFPIVMSVHGGKQLNLVLTVYCQVYSSTSTLTCLSTTGAP